MRLATAQQMRRMERRAIEGGIPSLALMENAAQALVLEAEDMTARKRPFLPEMTGSVLSGGVAGAFHRGALEGNARRAAVFCGPGNNGGDGIAAVRLLRAAGWEVRAFLVGERAHMTPDSREMTRRLEEAGGSLDPYRPEDAEQAAFCLSADLIIDALFGVGLSRPLEGDFLAAVVQMNRSRVPVLCADIPSGVEADTGRILGAAVEAARTVTFTLAKPGLVVGKGAICTGKLTVAPIGVPNECLMEEDFPLRTMEPLRLPRRPRDAYKGQCGKVYLLGGSIGLTGAPVLAAGGALRTGAGLVHLEVPARIYPIVAGRCLEAMAAPLPSDTRSVLNKAGECDAVLLGPGLGREARLRRLVLNLVEALECPVVLDADGINAVAEHIDVLDGREGVTVLTPHDGEFARLGGDLSSGDRLGAARGFAVDHNCILVLKGYHTITAFPDGRCFVNLTGNPGMAAGGSGDVLGGMIASLLAQHFPPEQAVPLAVWLHGRAGDLCAGELGEYGMLPSDLIQKIPYAMKELE